jgi:hypothetical protein
MRRRHHQLELPGDGLVVTGVDDEMVSFDFAIVQKRYTHVVNRDPIQPNSLP